MTEVEIKIPEVNDWLLGKDVSYIPEFESEEDYIQAQ